MIRRGLPEGVKEADSICHHTETMELAALRERAKMTGNWTPYDKLYGSILRSRTRDSDILLVASTDLALSAGCEIIARLILREDLWLENVRSRGVNEEKYRENYDHEKAEQHTLVNSRDDLYSIVLEICTS